MKTLIFFVLSVLQLKYLKYKDAMRLFFDLLALDQWKNFLLCTLLSCVQERLILNWN